MAPADLAAGSPVSVTCPACWKPILVDLDVVLDPGDEDDDLWPARVALALHLRTGCPRTTR